MPLYSGIDLHANNSVVVLLNEQDQVIYQRRLVNHLPEILEALAPYHSVIKFFVLDGLSSGVVAVSPDSAPDSAFAPSLFARPSGPLPSSILPWLLLDSRVVDVPMTYNPTFVMLSSLKPFFFTGLKHEFRFSDNVGT